jgi:hypothetical protein
MREPENCKIIYCGYSKPINSDEVAFEIMGLEALIKKAEYRIAELRQTEYLAKIAIEKQVENIGDLFEDK